MKYRLTCIVDKALVPTITALIIDRVHSYSVEEVERAKPNGDGRASHTAHRKKREWTLPAFQAIAAHMKQEPGKEFHYSELAPLLKTVNMNESSISPILSEMVDAGKIERVGRGLYRLIP